MDPKIDAHKTRSIHWMFRSVYATLEIDRSPFSAGVYEDRKDGSVQVCSEPIFWSKYSRFALGAQYYASRRCQESVIYR